MQDVFQSEAELFAAAETIVLDLLTLCVAQITKLMEAGAWWNVNPVNAELGSQLDLKEDV